MPTPDSRTPKRQPRDFSNNAENQEGTRDHQKLLAALNSEKQEERRIAIRRLGQLGPKAREAIPKLRDALKDSNHIIRLEAAIAIGFIGTHEEVPRLLPLLDDQVPVVRFQTISSLAFLRDPRATPALIERFDRETSANRDQILRAIGQLGGPDAFPLLKRGITDKDPNVRLGAVVGFGFLRDPRAKPLLQHIADHDEDELISHEARIALKFLLHGNSE